ncbi:MAG TPA: hypothetical protein VM619_04500 [Luteimonas sp.]|nr:hypothetical protein [Luteimonas sp.]
MDKDALILEIGRLLVADRKVAAQPWDRYALVAWHGEGTSTLNGFRYLGDQPGQPATPESLEIEDLLDALREATRVEGRAPWRACVVRLDKVAGKATAEFAYEDADAWRVTPASAAEVARRARP